MVAGSSVWDGEPVNAEPHKHSGLSGLTPPLCLPTPLSTPPL
jgi:hypothetical protein